MDLDHDAPHREAPGRTHGAERDSEPMDGLAALRVARKVARKAAPAEDGGGEGVETEGEDQADQVEAAVRAGRPARAALGDEDEGAEHDGEGAVEGAGPGPSAGAGAGVALKKRPALKASDFGTGMTFSSSGLQKSYEYKLWSHPGFSIPIAAVPGLFVRFKPAVKVKVAGGVDWKKSALKTKLSIDGGVTSSLEYGAPEVAALYGAIPTTASGSFEYVKDPKKWSLDGTIGLAANFKVGVKLAGGIVDFSYDFGKCEIGTLANIHWSNGTLDTARLGWEWGDKPKEFFASFKAAVAKAKKLLAAGADIAKKGFNKAKQTAQKAYDTGADAVNWVTSW